MEAVLTKIEAVGFHLPARTWSAGTCAASLSQVTITTIAAGLSGYFIIGSSLLYWAIAAAGAATAWLIPRALIARLPVVWLIASTALSAVLTQTIAGFLPDILSPHDLLAQTALMLSLGLVARSYLLYTAYADTFDALRASIAQRPFERWLSAMLNHPIDAIFGRVVVANTIVMLPATLLVILPGTFNYFVVVAHAAGLLLGLFSQEIVEHQNTHTRVFSPKIGASPRVKLILKALQFHFEYVLALLTARAPDFYRVQHVYVHHVEDNGPEDTHTTLPYHRTSFLDFSRHALWQSLDLVTGARLLTYLMKKGKKHQARNVVRGLAIWWAFIGVAALINPLGGVYLFISRLVGGTYISLITFYQHGLVDPNNPEPAHGHTIDFVDHEHGNLGFDYHVEHHHRPARHWAWYHEEHQRVASENGGQHPAVTIEKDKFGPLAFMAALWRKDYAEIARHAHIDGIPNGNPDEAAKAVAARARPIGAAEPTGFLADVDAVVSRAMAAAMPKGFAV